MSRQPPPRTRRWTDNLVAGGVLLNLALFVLNLVASIIFLAVAKQAAENNARIQAILDSAERRPKTWTEKF